ncbi:MAG TPA: hypothetical protein VM029_11665 [Opitutaceae bacterium]|nr:hypothetical protein [Opitutaceae bacterium]
MKSILRLTSLGALLLALAGCATTQPPQTPDTVNVLVNLPPTTSIIYSDRIADAFTDEVRHVFRQAGFNRPIENIRFVDSPDNTPNLLTINLHEWRFDRIGNITCTFTAQLQTPRGARNLGVYSETSLGISRSPGSWGVADSFEEAAQGAVTDLVRAVVKSDLLSERGAPTFVPLKHT